MKTILFFLTFVFTLAIPTLSFADRWNDWKEECAEVENKDFCRLALNEKFHTENCPSSIRTFEARPEEGLICTFEGVKVSATDPSYGLRISPSARAKLYGYWIRSGSGSIRVTGVIPKEYSALKDLNSALLLDEEVRAEVTIYWKNVDGTLYPILFAAGVD